MFWYGLQYYKIIYDFEKFENTTLITCILKQIKSLRR